MNESTVSEENCEAVPGGGRTDQICSVRQGIPTFLKTRKLYVTLPDSKQAFHRRD